MEAVFLSPLCPLSHGTDALASRAFSDFFDIVSVLSLTDHGSVNHVRFRESGKDAVVKSFQKIKLHGAAKAQVAFELRAHQLLQHQHLVECYAVFEDAENFHLVLEYLRAGDLNCHLGQLTEPDIRDKVVKPLVQALVELHDKGYVHRDIKPGNVLWGDSGAKLADMGFAVPVVVEDIDVLNSKADNPLEQASGTPLYTAPEILLAVFNNRYSSEYVCFKNDIWSLGVVVLECLTGEHPFNEGSYGNTLFRIASHDAVPMPAGISSEAKDWLERALQKEPEVRASASELLQHPWLSECHTCTGNICSVEADHCIKPVASFTNRLEMRFICWED